MAKASPNVSLDAFDLAILKILQRDNTTPQRVIGELKRGLPEEKAFALAERP